MPAVALYDANVLYPSTLRDVLIRVGLAQLVRHEHLIDTLDLPDLDDRHVLAAAITGGDSSVVAAIVDAIARTWKNADAEIVLKSLAGEAPRTAELIRVGLVDV